MNLTVPLWCVFTNSPVVQEQWTHCLQDENSALVTLENYVRTVTYGLITWKVNLGLCDGFLPCLVSVFSPYFRNAEKWSWQMG